MAQYSNPTISFILPIYNVGQYLDCCIESIIRQPYSNIEIILVDDGSTDNSSEICSRWSSQDNRIVFYRQKNQGVSVARNVGLSLAKGRWIAFTDPDDTFLPNVFCKSLVDSFDINADVVLFDYIVLCEKNNSQLVDMLPINAGIIGKDARTDLLTSCAYYTGFGSKHIPIGLGAPWAKLYSHKFLDGCELRFKPGVVRSQDVLFNLMAYAAVDRVQYIKIPSYAYHIRRNSNSSSSRYKDNADVIALHFLEVFLEMVDRICNPSLTRFVTRMELLMIQYVAKAKYLNDGCPCSKFERNVQFKRFLNNRLVSDSLKISNYSLYNFNQIIWAVLLRLHMYGLLRRLINIRN